MMHIQDSGSQGAGGTGGPPPGHGLGMGSAPPLQLPPLPPEFLQAVAQQLAQQALAVATGQAVGGFQAPARVVIARPTATPPRPTHPGAPQASAATPAPPGASLAQVISGLVGQLLLQPLVLAQGGSSATPTPPPSTSPGSTPSSQATPTPSPSPAVGGAPGGPVGSTPPPAGTSPPLAELLLLGAGPAGAGPEGAGPEGALLQGVAEFLQATQSAGPAPSAEAPPPSDSAPPPADPTPDSLAQSGEGGAGGGAGNVSGAGAESLPPEFFPSMVQGVLAAMLGSLGPAPPPGPPESIAAFLRRISGQDGAEGAGPGRGQDGFLGALLALLLQQLSMLDLVLLLHGRCQPLQRLQPLLRRCFRQHYLRGQEPTEGNVRAATQSLLTGLEEFIRESFAGAQVAEGVDITRTNLEFLQEHLSRIALHVLGCTDSSFGPRLLELCNRGLFECLALNLLCLRGERAALGELISDRIRRLSSDVSPALVGWLRAVVGLRLQAVLEAMPVGPEQVLPYVRRLGEPGPAPAQPLEQPMEVQEAEPPPDNAQREAAASPPPGTTAEEALPLPTPDCEGWARDLPPEWVPIVRGDLQSQRRAPPQPPLSDAYLSGMPAKRRKTMQAEPPPLLLAEAVGRAVRAAGARPLGPPESLSRELGEGPLQEGYRQQLQADLQRRLQEDSDFCPRRFPSAQRAFGPGPAPPSPAPRGPTQ